MEGFDWCSVSDIEPQFVQHHYSLPTFGLATGRTGSGQCLTISPVAVPAQYNEVRYMQGLCFPVDIAAGGTLYWGFAFKINTIPSGTYPTAITQVVADYNPGFDGRNCVLAVGVNSSKQLTVGHATSNVFTTIHATGSTVLSNDTWYHIEIKLISHASTGEVHLKLDGSDEITLTGADTLNVLGSMSGVILGCDKQTAGAVTTSYDDLYICDTSGSVNNSFLGNVECVSLKPNGAGSSTQFTPSAGSNYDAVNNATPDMADYVSSSTSTHKDLYAFEDASDAPLATRLRIFGTPEAGGSASIYPVCKSGATESDGTARSFAGFSKLDEIYEVDPNTSAAWTLSNFNAAEFGVKVV
jgi:hypothetical protein